MHAQALRMLVPFFIVNRQSAAQPRIFKFVAAVRTAPETAWLKVGAAGFCWGGKYTMLLAHDQPSSRVAVGGRLQPLIECGFTAHPSLVSLPSDIERVQRPLSVAVGNEDAAMSTAGIRQMEGILKKGDDHEVVILEGAKHGFAVRIDPTDELQNRYAKQAEGQAIAWFSKWLQG
jgi:dienelactone hydrolase